MKLSVKDLPKILEGVRNHILPPKDLKELITQTAASRLMLCKDCPFNSTPGTVTTTSQCLACGCFLTLKTKSLSSNCGLEKYNERNPTHPQALKWTAVASIDEQNQMDQLLKDEN